MKTKTLTATVACKFCGGTVMIEKQNVRDDENSTGGISTKMCPKYGCHRVSSYVYEIRRGQWHNFR